MDEKQTPLVYSCSGCSSAAQMANHLAVTLDRTGVAEMSCIAGVGGDVPSLVRVARSGRPIIAIDGCPLGCVAQILLRHSVSPTAHYVLRAFGVKKRLREDFSLVEAGDVLRRMVAAPDFPRSHPTASSAEGVGGIQAGAASCE